jgi:ABC-2 type transport system permease protein
MTAPVTAPSPQPRPARSQPAVDTEPVTLRRVLKSEWIKFRTLRSSWAVLGGAVLAMLLIGLIVAFNTRRLTSGQQPDDVSASATLQGYYLGQLLIGALGVLYVSGEFSTGMIRSTFTAVPTRLPVLAAKSLVFLVVSAVTMVAVSVVTFLAAQALIGHYRTGFSLADPTALRVVIGTGLYLALIGLLGGAIGWIVRSTPGALVTYFGLMLALPVIFGNLLGSWGKDIAGYLPSGAGGSFISVPPEPGSLSPWTGLAVLVIWIAVALALAAVLLRRRDA